MKLYAQHGYGDGQKIIEGLRTELLDGVIFSPKDIKLATMRDSAGTISAEFPAADAT